MPKTPHVLPETLLNLVGVVHHQQVPRGHGRRSRLRERKADFSTKQASLPAQFLDQFSRVESYCFAKLNEFDHIHAALTGLQVCYPGLVHPKLFGHVDLSEARRST